MSEPMSWPRSPASSEGQVALVSASNPPPKYWGQGFVPRCSRQYGLTRDQTTATSSHSAQQSSATGRRRLSHGSAAHVKRSRQKHGCYPKVYEHVRYSQGPTPPCATAVMIHDEVRGSQRPQRGGETCRGVVIRTVGSRVAKESIVEDLKGNGV